MYDIIVFENLRFRNDKRAFSKISTLESVFEKVRFRWQFSPDKCGRQAKLKNSHFKTNTDTFGLYWFSTTCTSKIVQNDNLCNDAHTWGGSVAISDWLSLSSSSESAVTDAEKQINNTR